MERCSSRKEAYEKSFGKVVHTPIGDAFANTRPSALTSSRIMQPTDQTTAAPNPTTPRNYHTPGTSLYDHIPLSDGPPPSTPVPSYSRATTSILTFDNENEDKPSGYLHTIRSSPPPIPGQYIPPALTTSYEPIKDIKVVVDDRVEEALMCDNLKSFNHQLESAPSALGYLCKGRVVEHHPEKFEEFVQGSCSACGEAQM